MTTQKLKKIRSELEKMDFITCSDAPCPLQEDAAIKVEYFREVDFTKSEYRFISSTVFVHYSSSTGEVDMNVKEVLSKLLDSSEIVDQFGFSF